MIVVIISGGSGSRLWPISRVFDPKPFIKLADGLSLLQNTFLRSVSLPDVKEVLTITNEKLHFRMQDEYQQVNKNHTKCNFILEPFGKNTASAVALATAYVKANYDSNETILILPSDHLINDNALFHEVVVKASNIALKDYIVTFGIKPEYPETGYGYIEVDNTKPIMDGYLVNRFVEKPNIELATQYLDLGNFLWNSGIFCGTVKTFCNEFESHARNLWDGVKDCLTLSKTDYLKDNKIIHLNQDCFADLEEISFDYAVVEKSTQMAVIPCDKLGWSDIGSWLAIAETLPKDDNNNAIIGESILHNVQDCLVYSTNRIIAGSDIDNLIIVDTPDAVLVANKNHSQNVKHIFEKLKEASHRTTTIHQTVHRPWGTYTILEEGTNYKVKRIEVKPGGSLSLQLHHHRSEHWVIVEGVATVVNGDNTLELHANESTYIPVLTRHRLENKTPERVVIIEVQLGNYLGEDDIVRFDDKYGREKRSE